MTHLSEALAHTADAAEALTVDLVDAVTTRGWRVATAESLTGGNVATVLSAAPGATSWFVGSVVSYSPEVKFGLLDVPRGPVVSAECAAQMARRTGELLGAELALALTGVGGPAPDEGEPAGTVWFAVAHPDGVRTVREVFDGDPPQVLTTAVARGLEILTAVAAHGPDAPVGHT
ncbi:CinA family protein [Cellulomonas bogoriensis]|uniref:Competence protein n=1 Tax=Cellulomonas bogoriensis 69B4 = DSM 16987 TaxID=1386082 RepID=A0A0A0BWE8_9CELL|nr:CinA family protein [Cellulomonas bogoriensis]KGM12032.1 competence protein [Cellulomonas bogoriensis 69B4 = DSM 16987]